MNAKAYRLRHISHKNKFVLIPIDHGFTMGPLKGIKHPEDTIRQVVAGGATAVIAHKGVWMRLRQVYDTGVIIHLSGSTIHSTPNQKILVGSVQEAIALGADAVSIQINIGAESESAMLQAGGAVSSACNLHGIPLIAMMYPRGPKIKDPFDPTLIEHATRIGCEIGADVVKTPYTGSIETFQNVVDSCEVPVIIAGGAKIGGISEFLHMVADAQQAGAAGVAVGRNIWQHENPTKITKAVCSIIFENKTVEETEGLLK